MDCALSSSGSSGAGVPDSSSFFPLPGSNKSSSFSSTIPTLLSRSASSISAFTSLNPIAIKSRTIDSTSRPTYPTSVYFVASTFKNGAPQSFARRRAISVFPTPVGPIIKMFFGATSSRMSSESFNRRLRLRNATATARLAFVCPMIYWSSFSTICLGVKESFGFSVIRISVSGEIKDFSLFISDN